MDEALHAVFFYVRTRNLQDATDLSIINKDDKLSGLFGCGRMPFSAVGGLLLERQLLAKVEPGARPIVFNYEMTPDGAEPPTKKRRAKATAEAPRTDPFAEVTTRRRSADAAEPAQAEPERAEEEGSRQTMMSCDVDVDVPNLFHVRTRDVLRRIKYREFDYTSNRIKAQRSLVATRIDEETAKGAIGDAVTGRGYAPYHRQALITMARGSHEGGEAQRAARIDLMTASLLERLEEQCSVARGFWDLVEACKGLSRGEEEKKMLVDSHI